VRYTTRPLSDRGWLRPAGDRRFSQFKVSWSQALDALQRELDQIAGRDLVIEIDVREQDLRLDGMLRANARADTPAVAVAFESTHGPLLYRSDQYQGLRYWTRGAMQEPWQHNVYAVALTLEALRAVDRYGAARSGEQYRGYRQIGTGSALVPDAPLTFDAALLVLARAAYPEESLAHAAVADIRSGRLDLGAVLRRARRHTHPDTGGTAEAFARVEAAMAVVRGGAR
jgi:hypothetical protein